MMNKDEQDIFKELAFEGKRVIYGAIHYWFCRMCGSKGDYLNKVKHEDWCPVGNIIKGWK